MFFNSKSDRQFIYDYFTVNDAVLFYKDFFNDFNEDKAQNLISFMKIDRNKKINELSKGNREKLHLAMVLSRDAKLYLLDEPIAGVDPVARDQILDAILENVNENATMLITTHLIHDIERVFDSVSFIHEGKIKLTDTVENLMNKYDNISIDNIYWIPPADNRGQISGTQPRRCQGHKNTHSAKRLDGFNLQSPWPGPNAWTIIAGDFVTTSDGTGLVHLAPAFGEDDMIACSGAGIRTIV